VAVIIPEGSHSEVGAACSDDRQLLRASGASYDAPLT
jgi:hypothetical protein